MTSHRAVSRQAFPPCSRLFNLADWESWLDRHARAIVGLSGPDFEMAYPTGAFINHGPASDLWSVVQFIRQLRASTAGQP